MIAQMYIPIYHVTLLSFISAEFMSFLKGAIEGKVIKSDNQLSYVFHLTDSVIVILNVFW